MRVVRAGMRSGSVRRGPGNGPPRVQRPPRTVPIAGAVLAAVCLAATLGGACKPPPERDPTASRAALDQVTAEMQRLKGPFGTVFNAYFAITNGSARDLEYIEIHCDYYDGSGTNTGHSEHRIHASVPARTMTKHRFQNRLRFDRSECAVVDLRVADR